MRSIDFLRYNEKKNKKKSERRKTNAYIHSRTQTHALIYAYSMHIHIYISSGTYGYTVWIFATDLVALGAALLKGVLLLVLELHDCDVQVIG